QRLAGLFVGEGVNGAQRGECAGRGCPGSYGPSENDRNRGNQSLHEGNPDLNGDTLPHPEIPIGIFPPIHDSWVKNSWAQARPEGIGNPLALILLSSDNPDASR